MSSSAAQSARERDNPEENRLGLTLQNGDTRDGPGDSEVKQDLSGGDVEECGGPPLPVGFWDSKLSKVRREVFEKWALVSKSSLQVIYVQARDETSYNNYITP